MRKTQKIAYASLFAALTLVATLFVRIPSVMGYFNIGDVFIYLACYFLGGWYAVAAAVVGPMLADLFAYPQYAIPTAVIKGLMAIVVLLIGGKFEKWWKKALAFFAGAILMMAGYFVTNLFYADFGLALSSLLTCDVWQGVVCSVLALLVTIFAKKNLLSGEKTESEW